MLPRRRYLDLGDAAGAAACQERALAVEESALGADDVEVAYTLANLAAAVSELGDHKRAFALLNRALSIEERRLGASHRDCAATRGAIATARGCLGDHGAKLRALEVVVPQLEAALGKDHAEVAVALTNLGNAPVLELITGRRPAWDIFELLYLAQIEVVFHDS